MALREFNRSEPLIRQGRNKVLVVKVRLKMTESEQVGPRGGGFQGASVDGLEKIVVHNVKLRADVVGMEVANQTNSAGM